MQNENPEKRNSFLKKAAIVVGDNLTSMIRLEQWESENELEGMIERNTDKNGTVSWKIKPLDHSFVSGSDL